MDRATRRSGDRFLQGGMEGAKGREENDEYTDAGMEEKPRKGAPSRSPPSSPLVLVHRPSQYVELDLGLPIARARSRKLRGVIGAAVDC